MSTSSEMSAEFRQRTIGRFQVRALGIAVVLLTTASALAQSPISDPVYPAGFDAAMLTRLVDAHLADAGHIVHEGD